MLERILAYSRKLNSPRDKSSDSNQYSILEKPRAHIDLARIRVYPSRYLCFMQVTTYLALLLLAGFALWPFFFLSLSWVLLWLGLACAVGVAIRQSLKVKNAAPMTLEIKQDRWVLIHEGTDFLVKPAKEVLVWSWVISIPLRENSTSKRYYLVVLPDSVNQEEWRRLRVWLLNCF